MPYHRFRTKGFFLRKEPTAEADLAFVFYSMAFGCIELQAKAIRKNVSKLQSNVFLFNLVEIEFIEGKQGKILTDCFIVKKMENILQCPERFLVAQDIADIIQEAVLEPEHDTKVWDLVSQSFKWLDSEKNENDLQDITQFTNSFALFLNGLLGYGNDEGGFPQASPKRS